jgi:hypothetical protein
MAKADLVPKDTNLRGVYASFRELVAACQEWGDHVNARMHRETGAAPLDRLAVEGAHLHALPADPHAAALGEERLVNDDQTVRFGSVRYSTPPGHVDTKVWCRVVGEELAIVAMTATGAAEIARHALSTPGNPRIVDEHTPTTPAATTPAHPRPRPRTKAEADFLSIGDGAHQWLIEAAATGATRVRAKMDRAVEFAAVLGAAKVDQALGLAAAAGRFDETDLGSILDHLSLHGDPGDLVHVDEAHSAQPGTGSWGRFGK